METALNTLFRLLLHDLFAPQGIHPVRDRDDLFVRAVQIFVDDPEKLLPGHIIVADWVAATAVPAEQRGHRIHRRGRDHFRGDADR